MKLRRFDPEILFPLLWAALCVIFVASVAVSTYAQILSPGSSKSIVSCIVYGAFWTVAGFCTALSLFCTSPKIPVWVALPWNTLVLALLASISVTIARNEVMQLRHPPPAKSAATELAGGIRSAPVALIQSQPYRARESGTSIGQPRSYSAPPSAPRQFRVGAWCRDGSQSRATGRGACSRHGGGAEWIMSTEVEL